MLKFNVEKFYKETNKSHWYNDWSDEIYYMSTFLLKCLPTYSEGKHYWEYRIKTSKRLNLRIRIGFNHSDGAIFCNYTGETYKDKYKPIINKSQLDSISSLFADVISIFIEFGYIIPEPNIVIDKNRESILSKYELIY